MSVAKLTIALLLGAVIGAGGTLAWTRPPTEARVDRVVAMAWGDGKYGKAFYGAQVYLEPVSGKYVVSARVHLGRGNDAYYDCGELGLANTADEAVARWGRIEFRADGLHIGDYLLSRELLEAHR